MPGSLIIQPASPSSTILFVTPPYHGGIAEIAGRWIPLGLVYLAGAARRAGLAAEIYDAMAKDHGYAEIEARFRAGRQKYVATSAITATVQDAVSTLELAKRVNPGIVTILGGIHPTFMYEELLRSSRSVDYVVVGEGEETLRELLNVLEAGGDPAAVPGLAFSRGDAVVSTPRRPLASLDDLDAAWDLVAWPDYTYFFIPDSRLGAVGTSRGCDQEGIYSAQQLFWQGTWRGRDPRRVADELAYLHETFQVDVFLLSDEHPTRDRARWEMLLDLLIGRKLPVSLLLETRVADIVRDRDILHKYREAGVVYVSIGIGATDRAKLDAVRDPEAVAEAKLVLELLRREGIVTEASFMIGFPDETGASVGETLKLAQQCNPDTANFLAVTPWPYSGSYPEALPYLRVKDYARYNLVDPVIQPEKMTLPQVEVALAECYRKFYMGKIIEVMTMKDDFRRRYLLKATKLFMGSPFIMKKLGLSLLGGFRK